MSEFEGEYWQSSWGESIGTDLSLPFSIHGNGPTVTQTLLLWDLMYLMLYHLTKCIQYCKQERNEMLLLNTEVSQPDSDVEVTKYVQTVTLMQLPPKQRCHFMHVTYSCLVLSSAESCSFLLWSDVGCCPLRLKDGGQTRVFHMRQPIGWDLDYPSTLQSLDWTLGTIPCDVTHNVKSFSSKQPDVFWDRVLQSRNRAEFC